MNLVMDTQAVDEVLFAASEDEPTTPTLATGPVDKTFRTDDRDQQFLLPPSIADRVPEGHLARFIDELVEEVLDLAPFYTSYTETRGSPPYAPRLMIKLLLDGYVTGVRTSRGIEKACGDSVAFRYLAANVAHDFRSIARLRRRHLDALRSLSLESLKPCQEAGGVRLGRVALDGSKRRAHASRAKAMRYTRMVETEQRLRREVDDLSPMQSARTAARTRPSARTAVTRTSIPSSPVGRPGLQRSGEPRPTACRLSQSPPAVRGERNGEDHSDLTAQRGSCLVISRAGATDAPGVMSPSS